MFCWAAGVEIAHDNLLDREGSELDASVAPVVVVVVPGWQIVAGDEGTTSGQAHVVFDPDVSQFVDEHERKV